MENNQQTCLSCGKEVRGRRGKKFCDDECRNAYHNLQNANERKFLTPVNAILRNNRKVLLALNTKGTTRVPKEKLLQNGFRFDYFTNVFTTKKGTYHFCYEQGYLPLENDWFMLVVDARIEGK